MIWLTDKDDHYPSTGNDLDDIGLLLGIPRDIEDDDDYCQRIANIVNEMAAP